MDRKRINEDSAHEPSGGEGRATAPPFLAGGGEAGALIRSVDWSATPLGPAETWPQVLKTLVDLMLSSSQPMFIVWGPALTTLYNDSYAEILADKHPAMGVPFDEMWHEIWERDLKPIVTRAYAGDSIQMDDIPLMMWRRGYAEETHFSFSYTPIRDQGGQVAGFFCPCNEITEQVLGARRQRLRAALSERLRELGDPAEIVAEAATRLARHFEVDRAAFAEIDPSGEFADIDRVWTFGEGPEPASIAGRYRIERSGVAFAEELRRGRTIVVEDVRSDPRTNATDSLATLATRSMAAFVNLPMLRDGRLSAVLALHSSTPRHWPAADIELAEEIAERTWSRLERARSDQALRESEARAKDIVESISDGFITLDADWRITYLNARGAEILKPLIAPGERILGEIFWERFPEVEQTPFAPAYRRALSDQVAVNVEAYYPPLDSWIDARCYPMSDGVAVHFLDVGERKRAEARLLDSEARFRTITEAMPQMVWSTDADGRHDFFNARWYEFTGAAEGSTDGDAWRELIHPDDRVEILRLWQQALATGEDYGTEYRLRHRSGEYRWVLGRAVAARDEAGQVIRWMGTCTDIHEMKKAEQHRRLLIDELNHRVKNTLAVVQSLAYQSFAPGVDPQVGRRAFEGRLTALAAAHDLLTQQSWEQAELQALAESALAAAGAPAAAWEATGPRVVLPPKAAVTIAIALHEMTTNALKHGALSESGGRIRLDWQVVPPADSAARERLRLCWQESGGPPVRPPERRGFGSRMIEAGLAAELQGEVSLDFEPGGLRCRIDALLPRLAESAA